MSLEKKHPQSENPENDTSLNPTQPDAAAQKTDAADRFESNSARVLRMRGVDTNAPAVEVEKESWFSNFWYHHKWKVLVIGAFAIIFVSLAGQFINKSNPDITLLYAGPAYMTPNQAKELSRCLYDIMDDYNEDGEKKIAVNDLVYLTAEQLLEAQAEAEAMGEDFTVDRQANAKTAEQFTYEIIAGESLICLLAKEQYDEIAEVDAFVPLSQLFSEIPEGAIDACGIRFCDTKFYQFYDAAQIFPEDTILAVRKLTTFNKMKNKKQMAALQQNAQQLFMAIVDFEYPEGYIPEDGD